MPIVRSMLLAYPRDGRATGLADQYLLGRSLLVAPVLEPGATTRSLYLPRGRWLEFWKAVRFAERDGEYRLRRPRPLAGRRQLTVAAPLERLPMMIRAGAIIPLLAPDVDTLTDYGRGRGLVHLGDRADEMHLLVFPRGRTRERMNDRERLRSRELGGERWRLRIRGANTRTYEVEAALGTLRDPFRPVVVRVDGEELPGAGWDYRRRGRVLTMDVRCRRCAVTVSAAPSADTS